MAGIVRVAERKTNEVAEHAVVAAIRYNTAVGGETAGRQRMKANSDQAKSANSKSRRGREKLFQLQAESSRTHVEWKFEVNLEELRSECGLNRNGKRTIKTIASRVFDCSVDDDL